MHVLNALLFLRWANPYLASLKGAPAQKLEVRGKNLHIIPVLNPWADDLHHWHSFGMGKKHQVGVGEV